MRPPRKGTVAHRVPAEQDVRSQEVLRANKELAAFFKGQRTEREARAALKIIKAFIRDRERADPANRQPLPITASAKPPVKGPKRKAPTAGNKIRRRSARREDQDVVTLANLEPTS